ncbi:exodeoxyribonuclease V subunit alpha [Buchnera aphidicola]|uniref:RecBCD enzyme subunit RecD n=1 Tax=Buchnera aphidicola str. Ua (Uroleucon ambrosiae) TaxID=1005057 RepID=G2LPU6_BUCUM|nr:exodeoxyribonuclease V subunit alpha [Buchnera aphidicola]AEO08233.1 exodeoxyribonuclease V 67 kDa polypeptide [Buchnera aphidicola str. Ua (Uroleucon ambrosiae)]
MMNLLKKAVQKKIINQIDLDFSKFLDKKNNIIILVAACISYENRQGHIFLPIQYFEKNNFFSSFNQKFINKILTILEKKINWEVELLKHSSCSNGSRPTPLVIHQKKIYLYKMWKSKNNILDYLSKHHTINKINKKKCLVILNNLFPNKKKDFQKISAATALLNKIVFIIGGPGTGKTTTILKIIIALIKSTNKIIKIQLSAPTGKATTRLFEMIKNNIFDIYLSEKEKQSILLTPKTIHQLLKIHKISQKSILNKNNLLDLDVLIIDEISMVDVLMMEKILFSVSKKTKLIFIGDQNQLRPIEPGSILRYIYYHIKYSYNAKNILNIEKITGYKLLNKIKKKIAILISNNICTLHKNYRFNQNSGIYTLAHAVINQKIKIIKNACNNKIKNIFFYQINSIQKYNNMIEQISSKYTYFWKIIQNQKNILNIIQAFQKHQTLCVLNDGLFGVNILNMKIEENMYHKKMIKYIDINKELWYIGKPIMITKNNPYLNVFNGNIGIININHNGVVQASFLKENNTIHNIPVKILKNYKTAWVMTIHKAQGSEFINTTLVLPNFYSSYLNQDIIYTGITRSQKTLNIFSKKDTFIKSVFNQTNQIRY